MSGILPARFAGALPVQSNQNRQNQLSRHLQHAGAGTPRRASATALGGHGDPEVHPQPESYRGCVNTIGIRSCYDEENGSLKPFASTTNICMRRKFV